VTAPFAKAVTKADLVRQIFWWIRSIFDRTHPILTDPGAW